MKWQVLPKLSQKKSSFSRTLCRIPRGQLFLTSNKMQSFYLKLQKHLNWILVILTPDHPHGLVKMTLEFFFFFPPCAKKTKGHSFYSPCHTFHCFADKSCLFLKKLPPSRPWVKGQIVMELQALDFTIPKIVFWWIFINFISIDVSTKYGGSHFL